MEQLDKNKGIMKNEYYTNRHYRNTDKIRIAVSNMNKDIRELSEYCDNLEAKIERLNNIINELEHHLYQEWLEWKDSDCESIYSRVEEDKAIYDYLQELKGSDKE